MNTNLTAEDILAVVYQHRKDQTRENYTSRDDTENRENYTSRENTQNTIFSAKPREECKHKNIETEKHISRSSEESNQTCPSDAFDIASLEVSPEGLAVTGEGVVLSARENYTSRVYTGIETFHNRTAKGIKINLTLQSAVDAESGACIKLTGELKRQDRFREIADYAGDADYFKQFVVALKQAYQKDRQQQWCIGRVHARGRRSQWFANVIVLAQLVDNVVVDVRVWIEHEDYAFNLDLALNTNQQQYYHTGGRYGSIRSNPVVPTLHTAERVLYK